MKVSEGLAESGWWGAVGVARPAGAQDECVKDLISHAKCQWKPLKWISQMDVSRRLCGEQTVEGRKWGDQGRGDHSGAAGRGRWLEPRWL